MSIGRITRWVMILLAAVVLASAMLFVFPSFVLAVDENDTHGYYTFGEGDKVNTYDGTLTFPRTDLFLPGKGGLNVTITRTYSSQAFHGKTVPAETYSDDRDSWGSIRPVESPFGMGWYFQVGRIDIDSNIIYYGDGGSEELFYDLRTGVYRFRMKTRQYAVWEYNQGADTSFLKMQNGLILKFDMASEDSVYGSSNKYVVQIENKYGHHIDIEYFSNTPFIRKIYDTLGRIVWFTYYDTTNFSEDTRLKSISYLNSNGDTCKVQYEYYDTEVGKPLKKVTYPTGRYESYEYSGNESPAGDSALFLSAVVLPTGGRIEYNYTPIQEYKWVVKESFGNCVVDDTLCTWHVAVDWRGLVGSGGTVSSRAFYYDLSEGWDWEFRCHNLEDYDEDSYPDGITGTWNYVVDELGQQAEYIYYPYVIVFDDSDCNEPWYTGSLKTIRWDEVDVDKTTSFLYEKLVIGYTDPDDHSEDNEIWVPVVKDVYRSEYLTCFAPDEKRYTKAVRYQRDPHTGTILNHEVYSLCDTLSDWNLDNAQQFLVRKDTVVNFEIDDSFNYLYIKGTRSIEGDDTVYNTFEYGYTPSPVDHLKSLVKKFFTSGGISCTTSYLYDYSGNVGGIVNPNGNLRYFNYAHYGAYETSTYSYANGIKIVDSTTYYHNTGLPKTKVDANGNVTYFYYDHANRLDEIVKPLDTNHSMYLVYDGSNRIIYEYVKKASGSYYSSSRHFDEFGRLYETRQYGDDDTIKTITEYNSLGRVKRVSRPFSRTELDTVWTEFEYDILGRLTKITNPDSTTKSISYHELTVERYDELNRRSKNTYDVMSNLLYSLANWDTSSSVYQDTIGYTYGTFNRLLESKDPKGLVTKYWYSSLMRVSADSAADRGKNYYIYDKIGNLRFRKDANGTWVYNRYDPLNRLIEQGTLPQDTTPTQENAYDPDYPDSIGEQWKIKKKYDSYSEGVAPDNPAHHTNPKGNLTEVQDQSGHTYYFYDRRNRIAEKHVSINGLAEKKVKYYCNYADQIDSLHYPDGSAVPYQYDQFGRLEDILGYVDGGERGFEYTSWGAIDKITFNNLMITAIDYDIRGFVTKIRHIRNSDLQWGRAYGRDATGNITREYSVNLVGIILDTLRAYEYDNLNRLERAGLRDYDDKLISYGYDRNGNRTYRAVDSDTISYFYNPNKNQLKNFTGQTDVNYVYDANGNMTQDSSKAITLGYDYRNMLTQVSKPKIILGRTYYDQLYFDYNAKGQRVKKKHIRKYLCECEPYPPPNARGWGPGGQCVCTKITYTYYIYSGNSVIAEYNDDDGLIAKYIYGNGQRLVKEDTLGNKFFYHTDYLGSTRIITDTLTNKVFERDYYPFGSELMASGYITDYKYNGKEHDQELGIDLYYYGARYYDPEIGRFISVDPVKDYTNPYSYVRNNPINATDPSGMVTHDIGWITHGGFPGGYSYWSPEWAKEEGRYGYVDAAGYFDGEDPGVRVYYIETEYEVDSEMKQFRVYLEWSEEQGRFYVDFDAGGEFGAMGLLDAISKDPEVQEGYYKPGDTYCNIFVEKWLRALNITITVENPREWLSNAVYETYSNAEQITGLDTWTSQPLPGDIVVWRGGRHGHMGIYLGERGGSRRYYGYGAQHHRWYPISDVRSTRRPIFIRVPYEPTDWHIPASPDIWGWLGPG